MTGMAAHIADNKAAVSPIRIHGPITRHSAHNYAGAQVFDHAPANDRSPVTGCSLGATNKRIMRMGRRRGGLPKVRGCHAFSGGWAKTRAGYRLTAKRDNLG